MRNASSSVRGMHAGKGAGRGKMMWRQRYLYLLLIPSIVLVVIFCYLPMAGLYMGFADYKLGQSMFSATFVGFEHFRKFFGDVSGVSMRVFRNTLGINLLNLVLGMVIPCTFALFLNEVRSNALKRTVQTVTFFPFFLSAVVIYSIAYNFFSSNSGVINKVLLNLQLIDRSINFLGNPNWAWPLIVFISQWSGFGYGSIVYLAAISGIDQEQYEAAEIDGAGRFGRMRHVTLPNLLPTVMVLLILNVGGLLGSDFSTMYVFTNQLNRDAMEVFSTYVYRMGLQKLRFSYATAAGLVLSVVGLGMTLGTNALARKVNGQSIF